MYIEWTDARSNWIRISGIASMERDGEADADGSGSSSSLKADGKKVAVGYPSSTRVTKDVLLIR